MLGCDSFLDSHTLLQLQLHCVRSLLLVVDSAILDCLPLHQNGTVHIQYVWGWNIENISANATQRFIPLQGYTYSVVWQFLSSASMQACNKQQAV